MAIEAGNSTAAVTPAQPRGTRVDAALRRLLQRQRALHADERIFLLEQLTLLLESGVSIHAALQSIEQQSDTPVLRRLLATMRDDVAAGKALSAAMAAHPGSFSRTYVALLEAAEQGGFLQRVLTELLAIEERRQALRATIVAALTYPAFLLAFSVLVVIFILVVVFPQFAELFEGIYDRLPVTTKVLLAASERILHAWPALLGVTVAVVTGAWLWLRSATGRAWLGRVQLTLPVLRTLTVQINLVRIFRLMSLSLRNGVTVTDTLEAIEQSVGNARLRRVIVQVAAGVQQGSGLAAGFRAEPLMPALVCQLLDTGEQAGELPHVSGKLADHYEKLLRKRIDTVTKMAEPVMLLVMGLVVGVLVSSLILPIFKLSSSVA